MHLELDPSEQRVIGSLLEKERTVPDTYPMTLNGVRTACNQSSGREPVTALSDTEVQRALDRLRAAGLTRILHPSHGARMPKHRQVLDEVLHLNDGQRAVLTLLLLRGPQTPGELRARADRLHLFASLMEVEQALTGLRAAEPPLVRELERRPGQKEQRWIHLLGPVSESAGVAEPPSTAATDDEVSRLRSELAEAHAEIERLHQLVDDLTTPPS